MGDDANGDREPAAIDYDPVLIPIYLRRAAWHPHESERERSQAVRWLHAVYRRQLKTGMDFRILDFVREQSERIWASENPVDAMQELFGSLSKRGAPVRRAERDFELTLVIEQRVRAGEKVIDIAIDLEASHHPLARDLNSDSLRNIYSRRNKRHVEAELNLRGRERGQPERGAADGSQ